MGKPALLMAIVLGVCQGCAPAPVMRPDRPSGTGRDQTGLDALRNAFLARVTALGLEIPYRPKMREWTRPGLVSFREEERAVAVPRYDELAPATRHLLDSAGGRELFEQAFRWFFPAGELVHFLQVEFGWRGEPSTAERLANDLAVAFHRAQPGGPGRLSRLAKIVEQSAGAFPKWRLVLDSLRRTDGPSFEQLVVQMVGEVQAPAAVMLDASLDVGFHVAAHLQLPDRISLYHPGYQEEVASARKELFLPDLLLKTQVGHLSAELARHQNVQRLVLVPALFPDFNDTKTAFDLLLRRAPPSASSRQVHRRLKLHLLPLHPDLERFSGWEHDLALELAAVIQYEYESFHSSFHRVFRRKWDWERRKFRDEWYRQMAPAIAALNPDRQIRQVVIVLSPALRRRGISYRIHDGIARVASLLPRNPREMEQALLDSFLQLCRGIAYRLNHGEMIDSTARQAAFEALGGTNPDYQERFIRGSGSLARLAKQGLLAERLRLAGRELPADKLAELRDGLEQDPAKYSRLIYRQGLLVPARVLVRLRALVPGCLER